MSRSPQPDRPERRAAAPTPAPIPAPPHRRPTRGRTYCVVEWWGMDAGLGGERPLGTVTARSPSRALSAARTLWPDVRTLRVVPAGAFRRRHLDVLARALAADARPAPH
ncbi:hypothetical protein [Roseisolibacter sp. H3M3-2]|uniref:hypothetical protein n=1 Tax=Roseisolibacter sp. H3M3-2 TaxID=3031323 RepID=UPI0023DA5101|nr:hypothetical protein [Roseisolibacter sp. H3M3-2]MDF1505872.1 hypothetical protein [Roseisolibacter sp. H3M3-2]